MPFISHDGLLVLGSLYRPLSHEFPLVSLVEVESLGRLGYHKHLVYCFLYSIYILHRYPDTISHL